MKTLSQLLAIAILSLAGLPAQAQNSIPVEAKPLPGNPSLLRWESRIYRKIEKSSEFPLKVPRFCAAIRSTMLVVGQQSLPLDVSPEIDHWILSLKNPPTELSGTVVLEFDSAPLLIDELSPIAQLGDGSLWLPAHFGKTSGDKLRYEPQPHKNTVGYWTVPTDSVQWNVRVEKAGKFNLAVLQGCGGGQGGSIANLQITSADGKPVFETTFEVLETGHFQNFQWKQLEAVELKEAGLYTLKVQPKQIRKAALMDIRAIQLLRLP